VFQATIAETAEVEPIEENSPGQSIVGFAFVQAGR